MTTRDTAEEKKIRARIGAVIEARRVMRGLTPSELARAAGVDDRQMHRALRGESGLSIYALARVARALGWTLGELMYVAFPPSPKGRRPPSLRSEGRVVHEESIPHSKP